MGGEGPDGMKPHVALWPGGAYTPVWGVWRSRADCRDGKPPVKVSYFFDTIEYILRDEYRYPGLHLGRYP